MCPHNSCRQSDHDRSAVMVLLQFVDIGLISASQQRIDSIIIVAVLRRAVNQPLTQLLVRQAVEVIRQCGSQLLLTNRALFKHQFLHCRQAVAEVSNADLQARTQSYFAPPCLMLFARSIQSSTSAEQRISCTFSSSMVSTTYSISIDLRV